MFTFIVLGMLVMGFLDWKNSPKAKRQIKEGKKTAGVAIALLALFTLFPSGCTQIGGMTQ
jgi:hypothetical protein